ncbi:acyl dehydratase [Antricoccus suffuscus]|uniref:Acyl dehydratase n=1 Tax=Antricoccus suffuscus TaxID=1629062 RepID=A0A2T1A1P6_9ACTN|nr:MaoC/PaaZ C-terminal domain-containing protein [Antricoccus suffuscus]PRZ42530.1 acyl dehydratase [Antricoccus suffuscus]
MTISVKNVGCEGAAAYELLEDRWVMNYAASVGDTNPVYFDNLDGRLLPAHPNYVSHLEWDAIGELHDKIVGLTDADRLSGVHSFNDTRLHRPIVSGDELSSIARVVGVERRRSGARMTIAVVTSDAAGRPVATSYTSTVYRGAEVSDGDDVAPEVPEMPDPRWLTEPVRSETIELSSIAPHVFSECARDYNPIHTDMAVAKKAQLPGLILHGTGTFAYALSSLTNYECGGDPTRVRRFRGRLGAMVLCPSRVRMDVYAHAELDTQFRFELVTEEGAPAISDGYFAVGGLQRKSNQQPAAQGM